MDNSTWLNILLLAAATNFDLSEYQSPNNDYVKNCPKVEWEEDMGKTIPFCKIDGQLCNQQCRRKS